MILIKNKDEENLPPITYDILLFPLLSINFKNLGSQKRLKWPVKIIINAQEAFWVLAFRVLSCSSHKFIGIFWLVYMCRQSFTCCKNFLHCWFGVIGIKWKSRKWERFLPHCCAWFLYIDSFKILFYLFYLVYSMCMALCKNNKYSKLLSNLSPTYIFSFMSASMPSLCILCA